VKVVESVVPPVAPAVYTAEPRFMLEVISANEAEAPPKFLPAVSLTVIVMVACSPAV